MEKELETLAQANGHVNLQHLKLKSLVGGLPKFGTEEVISKVCEACQLAKQIKHPFLV
jgi:hypothetical protein